MQGYNYDDELVYLMRCGSEEAQDILYKRYYRRVSKWVLAFTKYFINGYEYEDFMNLRKDSPIQGIQSKLKNIVIIDLIKEFFDISYYSLRENKKSEEKYLEPVYEYIALKRVPADNLIEEFNRKIS